MASALEIHEYAYDVKLCAVVRVKAGSRAAAEKVLRHALDCADLNVTVTSEDGSAFVTEASICIDDADFPFLFEIDGQDVDSEDLSDNQAKY